jgi:pimeloyl-ACP methyl ester carboxylesterase
MRRALAFTGLFLVLSLSCSGAVPKQPKPPGRLVQLGGHRLHVYCTGRGSPTVVVEAGLADFSFDWILVQRREAPFARVCTYDRSDYAFSDPGPQPRTYAQINLELHDALHKLGERFPLVLVGHSFGGGVVRHYAAQYPGEVAGMVLVDAVSEEERININGKAMRVRDSATGRAIPQPHEAMLASDLPAQSAGPAEPPPTKLEPPLDRLPMKEQQMQLWAYAQPALRATVQSEVEWSPEEMLLMHNTPQAGVLGRRPLVVLTRAEGGYGNDLGVPAAELERERLAAQAALARLSTRGRQIIVNSGHNMELEAPDQVASAIRDVVEQVRSEP